MNISPFPLLNKQLISKMGFSIMEQMTFSYENNGHLFQFDSDGDNEPIMLVRPGWNPDTDALQMKASYSFGNLKYVFGEEGIACKNAILGVAILWKSHDSRQRGVIIDETELDRFSLNVTVNIKHCFKNAQFRGRVSFETVLYIKTIDNKYNEKHLANIQGAVLGVLDQKDVYFDGYGSTCQTYRNPDPNGPLWRVLCSIDEPLSDSFYENVVIEINPLHPGYTFIDLDSKQYNPEMLKEIMAAQMAVVVMSVKMKCSNEDWKSIVEGDAERGSIGNVIFSLINQGVDTESPISCADSIRRYLKNEELNK